MKFDSFDKKVEDVIKRNNFSEIYMREVVWTYMIAKMALVNAEVYEKLTGLNHNELDCIYLESQPLSPYKGVEGNSRIDLSAGAIQLRNKTTSGIEFSNRSDSSVCFVEAKYFSDLDVKTEHYPTRNQMDRVIENLLCFQNKGQFPDKLVFTLLTPRLFQTEYRSRIYGYKFKEYVEMLGNQNKALADLIRLDSKSRRQNEFKYPSSLEERLEKLSLNWVSFEDLIEIVFPISKKTDITIKEEAKTVWDMLRERF